MNTETPKINPPDTEFRAWAAEIVSAYIGNNPVAVTDVPPLIAQVHHVLSRLGTQIEPAVERPQPAVPIKKSVTPEWIICLEDGKKVKMLRRHLQKVYDMTPQQYRQRWGLPAGYPMVAPHYTQQRSAFAKASGFGTRRAASPPQTRPPAND